MDYIASSESSLVSSSPNIKNICIDLNINRKIVSLLEYLRKETIVTFNFIEEIYFETRLNEITDDLYHSHTFKEMFDTVKSFYKEIDSFSNYLNNELTFETLKENYFLWKTVAFRGTNYENESSFLAYVIQDLNSKLLLPYRLFVHYFTCLWYDSETTTYNFENYSITTTPATGDIEAKRARSVGVINNMNLKKKRDFLYYVWVSKAVI